MLDIPRNLTADFKDSVSPAKYLVVMSQLPLGIVAVNGEISNWFSLNDDLSRHLQKSRYSAAPAIIHNLHPEQSFIGPLLNITTKRDYIGSGDEKGLNCLSNIRIIKIDDNILKVAERIPASMDVIKGHLGAFTSDSGVFEGVYSGPFSMKGLSPEEDGSFRRMWVDSLGERFSGQRRKIPLSLDVEGNMTLPEDGLPFTHIGKYAQLGGHESLAVSEFMGLSAARAGGLRVAPFALISQGPELPPMFVTQRFDIQENPDNIVFMQDFYSMNGEDPEKARHSHGSYEAFLSQWNHQLRGYDEAHRLTEMREAFTSLLVSYVINDSDKHPKNFTTLKSIDRETLQEVDLRFAPTFDAVCDVITGRQGKEMFFKLREKDQGRRPVYHMNDWLDLLKTSAMKVGDRQYGIFETKEDAEHYVRTVASRAAQAVIDIAQDPPEACRNNAFSHIIDFDMKIAASIAYERAFDLGANDLDIDIDCAAVWKVNKKEGPKVREAEINRMSTSGYLKQYGVSAPDDYVMRPAAE